MLTSAHMMALTPVILVCATAVTVMLGIAWRRQHAATALVSILGLNLALVSLYLVYSAGDVSTPLLVFDRLSMLGMVLVLASTLACLTMSHAYLEGYPGRKEEFYLLMLCAAAGGMVLVASQHLATLFFGLELLSMPLYGMLAYTYRDKRSLESGIKYLVLSAAATAFLLFGMALLYSQSGRLDIAGLLAGLESSGGGAWALAGAGLMLVGLGFKLSIVPFHLWTPDVYQGGPGPAATFLATASKAAVFIVLLRIVMVAPAFHVEWLHTVLGGLALLTMIVGNLLALIQTNLKRLLGYSSIAHFGYLLVALVVADGLAVETAGIYLITYLMTTLGAFGVVTLLSSPYSGEDASALHHYRGLFWRRPYLAAVLTVCLLSLAGIPFTAGFIGKFYIVALGVEAGRWWLVGGIIAGSVIGLYYYLRVMVTLYLVEPGMRGRDAPDNWGMKAGGVVVLGLALLVIAFGVYPTPVIDWMSVLTSPVHS
ncbi:MAG: NADH-quinone oxidoreductase subunit NuoN [Alteromonadaceae bacterium]|nr:NADH-quinone oxidoreductase subunit NuoN [Alteromonadaceae bacterium]MBH86430.1 NADH-quinone oxidoreductase subunit NuoN [Alteromonadaceae bacterium]|tara:strand:+ start:46467 stop:47915 length:1449 start_codon:yes stop_codon:yes gene_type:complete